MTCKVHDLERSDIKSWRLLARAFFCLAHNDSGPWKDLPDKLRLDAGLLCERYLREGKRDRELIEAAGTLIAGPNWYTAIGR